MVFTRISTGCDECRVRHTKCDGGSPSCGRCLRRQIACPGYRHVGGFVFKPQTYHKAKIRGRVRLEANTEAVLGRRLDIGFKYPDHFAAFFFSKYIFAGRRNEAGCGLFDQTSVLCRRAHPSSTLAQAIVVLGATTFILSQPVQENEFLWYHELRLRVVKSMQYDLQCQNRRMHDDTLLAVLLLDFIEVIVRTHLDSRAPLSHQCGALTLLKLRGRLNFKSEQAISLYNAARHAALRWNYRTADISSTLRALDLLAKSKKISQPPALQLMEMFEKISELQLALENALSHGQHFGHVYDSAVTIQRSLDMWANSLPSNWLPSTIFMQDLAGSRASSKIELYESIDIAAVFGLWRVARLKLTRLFQVFHQSLRPSLQPLPDDTERIFDEIHRSVPVFLGWLEKPGCVEQDIATRAWNEQHRNRKDPGTERFPGDHLGKWFLSDLLRRLEETIGDDNELTPPLYVTRQTLIFLREQRRVLSALSPFTKPLIRAFPECTASD